MIWGLVSSLGRKDPSGISHGPRIERSAGVSAQWNIYLEGGDKGKT